MAVVIRHAEAADYARVAAVVDEWWGGRKMAAMLPKLFFVHFRDTSFVAEDEGAVAGFLCGFRSQTFDDEAYVHFVGVDPERRGAGLGRELYERFFDAVRPRSIVRAVTSPANEASVAFHRSIGFEVERVDDDYDGAGEARVLLVRRSMPETSSEPSALMQAHYRGDADTVARLRAAHPELDLFEAAALGEADRVDELLDTDPELVRAWSPDGANALHFAAFFGHPAAARLLLDRGADANAVAQGFNHVAPLHSAAAADSVEIVRMLLEAGADPRAEQDGGFTALDAARQNGNAELERLLLEHGA